MRREGLEIVEEYAFYGDTGITTLTIPTTVLTIRPYAFAYLDGLTALTYNAINASGNYPGEESTGFNADGNVFACSVDADDLTVTIGNEVEQIPAFMFYAMVTDGTRPTLCTDDELFSSVASGARTTVNYCDCDPFATVLANSGSTTGLAEHGNVSQISYATVAAMNALSSDFDATKALFDASLDWTDAYENLVDSVSSLFALSEDATAKSIEPNAAESAVIGVNDTYLLKGKDHYLAVDTPNVAEIATYYEYNSSLRRYVLTEDAEIVQNKTYYRAATYADYLVAIAKLFGYADAGAFATNAQAIADLYGTNAAGATANTARGRLTYDGAVLTKTGDYILPYFFTTATPSMRVLAFAIVDGDGTVSVWVDDVDKLFVTGNVGEKQTVTVTAKGRCSLFDLHSGQTRVVAVNFPLTNVLTGIGDYAFAYLTDATFSALPESVCSVSSYAFYECEGIKTLALKAPELIDQGAFMRTGLTTLFITNCSEAFDIGASAFEGCPDLSSVLFDCDGLAITIGAAAFKDDISLVALSSIPDETAAFGDEAFAGCSALTTVNLGDSITEIPNGLFKDCVSLTTFTIPATVESIGDSAFENCTSYVDDLVLNVPIGERAYFGCVGLTSVTLGDDVTSVGDYAFFGATGITSVTIGEGLVTIGDAVFYDTVSLSSVTYNAVGEENGSAGTLVFVRTNATSLPAITVTIGANVEYVPNNLFGGANVALIQYAARDSVDPLPLTIGNRSFENLPLSTVELPDFVIAVGNYAFAGCAQATTLRLGAGLTTIGYRAFSGMSHVTTLYHDAYQLSDGNFSQQSNGNVFFGLGAAGAGVNVVVDAAVTKINAHTFNVTEAVLSSERPKLLSVIFESGTACVEIGAYAFCYIGTLTTVTGLTGLTTVGAYAFNTSGITVVPCESTLTSIGEAAFGYCNGLTSVTLGENLTSLGDAAFAGCSGLTDLVVNTDQVTFSNAAWIAGGGTASGGIDVVFGKIDKIPDNIFYKPSDSSMTAPVVNSVTCADDIAEVIYTRDKSTKRTIHINITEEHFAYDYYCRGVGRTLSVGDNAFYGVSVGSFDFSGRNIGNVGDNAFRGTTASIAMTLFNWSLDSDDPALYYAFRPTDLQHFSNGTSSIQDVVYLHDGTVGEDFFMENLPQLVVENCSIGSYAFDGVENVQLTMYRPKFYNLDEPICHLDLEGGYRIETNPDFSKLTVGAYAFRNSTDDYVNYGVQFIVPDASVNYRAFGADLIVSAGDYAFYGCGRINGSSAFTGVFENLTGDGIGDYAFAKTKIAGVQFGSTTKRLIGGIDYSFGLGMFDDTSWYENASDGILYIAGYSRRQIDESDYDDEDNPYYYVYGYKGTMPSQTTLTFENGTKRIAKRAIEDEDNLCAIVIPDTVEEAYSDSFYGCNGLFSITAPLWIMKKVVTTSVHAVTVTAVNGEINGAKITDRMFNRCYGLVEVNLCDGITAIGEEAFRACGSLIEITLPDSVRSIGRRAFYIENRENTLTIHVGFSDHYQIKCYHEGTEEWVVEGIDIGIEWIDDNVVIDYTELSSVE